MERSTRIVWLPAAAILLGTGWGANQFTPMLLVYRGSLDLSTGTLEAIFGLYALGLIPGLLLAGPLSDAHGRRSVIFPAAVLSLAASLTLAAGGHHVVLLFVGRLMAGVASGAVFATGTAWLRELSRPPLGAANDHTTARRAAVAMTAGFALGPLATGLLAQWAPAPAIVPYLPHIILMAFVLFLLRNAPETVTPRAGRALRISLPGIHSRRFRRVVAPMAPWVFAAPAIAFALLPSVVGTAHAEDGTAVTAAITALCALAGVLIQPLARRLDTAPNRSGTVGLLLLVAGLVLAAVTTETRETWMLVPSALVLGSAYGLCLVAGLIEIQALAGQGALAGLTAGFYALTYLGFAAPYVLAEAAHLASYTILLTLTAALALGTAALVTRQSARAK